jgi:small multidrug resistance pump
VLKSWLFLLLAIVSEVIGTTALKLSEGLSRPGPAITMFVMYGLAFTLLAFALKGMEVGVAYAVWSGLGTVAITLIGVYWFDESLTWTKTLSIVLVVAGVVGLNLGGGH